MEDKFLKYVAIFITVGITAVAATMIYQEQTRDKRLSEKYLLLPLESARIMCAPLKVGSKDND